MRPTTLFVLALLFLTPVPAYAQNCSFSVTGVNFGSVDTLSGAAVDATGTVEVTCEGLLGALLPVRVCLNINAGSGGATSGTRHMRNAANAPLNFNFYQDAARQTPWGSRTQPALGNPVSLTFSGFVIGVPQTQVATIYGRVLPNQQSAATGGYTSTFSGADVSFNRATALTVLLLPDCQSITGNTTSASFTAQANVVPNCRVTAQNIDFGNHGVLDTAVDAAGGLDVTCTPGTDYAVALNNGLTGTSPTDRRMTLGGQAVVYGLYKDAARSQPWGSSGGQLLSNTGTGATQSVPVYGRVPAQPTPAPGTYTDTVVVTVTY
ncbi:spore coat protein U-like protein [Mesorhizobium sp. J18]|uniref:Csu type fimbrial protein n=1 Tax=Mesorhizobium sp. J18 TaxID=935263 RepID=UPI00119972D3|nr:spore coat U domain-containing protein [Mesorhizobium sp. J18]TWG94943.1 spore coat protein U-like protein [Mesorhizobium sp. J18]